MSGNSGGYGQSKQIELTIGDISQLVLVFRSQWRRDPTPEELRQLVDDKVREEVLYREALALGLDKDDTIVKRSFSMVLWNRSTMPLVCGLLVFVRE